MLIASGATKMKHCPLRMLAMRTAKFGKLPVAMGCFPFKLLHIYLVNFTKTNHISNITISQNNIVYMTIPVLLSHIQIMPNLWSTVLSELI